MVGSRLIFLSLFQGFSLYNNTKLNANFKVDAEGLRGSPLKYVGGKNEISAVSNYNLMFTFLPYCCKMYEVSRNMSNHKTITIN